MFASVLIIAISLILLGYWFRYTCILLLRIGTSDGIQRARAGSREFQHVLSANGDSSLEPLHGALQRDYALLTYLLEHAADLEVNPLERHLLVWDYRMMNVWYRLTNTAAPVLARRALHEMAAVVGHFAQRLDEQSGTRAEV